MKTETKGECPRCGIGITFALTGAFVAFCPMCLAFLLPEEFTAEQLKKLRGE